MEISFQGGDWAVARRGLAWLALLLACLVPAGLASPAACGGPDGLWARVGRVNDGDTLGVRLAGRRELVRLLGVDSPETLHSPKLERAAARAGRSPAEEDRLGRQAREFAAGLLAPGQRVRLVLDPGAGPRDAHGRILAYVFLEDGRMLNELLVAEGQARAFRRCRCQRLPRLLELEDQARRRGLGIWGKAGARP